MDDGQNFYLREELKGLGKIKANGTYKLIDSMRVKDKTLERISSTRQIVPHFALKKEDGMGWKRHHALAL